MKVPLSTSHLLQIWEQGDHLPPYQVAATLVQASLPPEEHSTLGEWGIGQRDRYLLQLRARLFGNQIEGLVRCPTCDEYVELAFSITDLVLPEAEPDPRHEFENEGYRIRYRVPNVGDLNAVMANQAPQELLLRCVLTAWQEGVQVEATSLPSTVLDQLSIQMGNADPQAQIEFDLNCPNCAANWQAPFDIVSFLWREIGAWARRVLREVHILASAYGWSQEEILRLSPIRRRHYIEMVLGEQ